MQLNFSESIVRRRPNDCARWLLRRRQLDRVRCMRFSGDSAGKLAGVAQCVLNEVAPRQHLHMGCGEPLRSQWLLDTVSVVQVAALSTR